LGYYAAKPYENPVTGVTGFLGGHLASALADDGQTVAGTGRGRKRRPHGECFYAHTPKGELFLARSLVWTVHAKLLPAVLAPGKLSRLAGIMDSIHIHTATLAEFLSSTEEKVDKFALLDHTDWLGGADRSELVREWDGIIRTASDRARIIFRTAGPDAGYLQNLPLTSHGRPAMWQECVRFELLGGELHQNDRVSIYGNFYICTLNRAE
jgi:S-adenosylmethionine:diacylglycerol 3-amino-3-carboxypropyl transferase